jgi:uncharacterized protein GlcG (DUF336 family)
MLKIAWDSMWDSYGAEALLWASDELHLYLMKEIQMMDLLALAKTVADRVEEEATEVKVPVAVCVVDIHGNVVLTHRMGGAPAFSLEIAERKAYTSALVRVRTADLLPLVQPGQPLYPLSMMSGGRYSALGGGIPLSSEGEVVAGVGVSGGTVDQDVAIVEAALKETANT